MYYLGRVVLGNPITFMGFLGHALHIRWSSGAVQVGYDALFRSQTAKNHHKCSKMSQIMCTTWVRVILDNSITFMGVLGHMLRFQWSRGPYWWDSAHSFAPREPEITSVPKMSQLTCANCVTVVRNTFGTTRKSPTWQHCKSVLDDRGGYKINSDFYLINLV